MSMELLNGPLHVERIKLVNITLMMTKSKYIKTCNYT